MVKDGLICVVSVLQNVLQDVLQKIVKREDGLETRQGLGLRARDKDGTGEK